jgi:hypothetical protein
MPWDPQGSKRTVVASLESDDGMRCVDVIDLRDGSFALKEFRRDPEDGGGWTLVADFSAKTYASGAEAERAARDSFPWLKVERRSE